MGALSPYQQRLVFLDQFNGGSAHCNRLRAFELEGCFNPAMAEQALSALAGRHHLLRARFVADEGGARQLWVEAGEPQLRCLDLSAGAQPQTALHEAIHAEMECSFDLARGCLLRLCHLRLGEGSGMLLLTAHGIIADERSMTLLADEFWWYYAAAADGSDGAAWLPARQFQEYLQWRNRRDDAEADQLQYWARQLDGLPPVHALPLDGPRPAQQGYRGGRHVLTVEPSLARKLAQLARDQELDLAIVLHTALSVLLARHGGGTDSVIGRASSLRPGEDWQDVLGPFGNMLAVRTSCADNPSFLDHLRTVQAAGEAARAHGELPFERIVERLNPARSPQYTPLFQIVFGLNEDGAPQSGPIEAAGLRARPFAHDEKPALYELAFHARGGEQGLALEIVYNADLFKHSTIVRMAAHMQILLQGIAEAPETKLHQLPLMSEAEQQWLAYGVNATQTPYPQQRRVHQLFEDQACKMPLATAVEYGEECLSYAELNARAQRLAHRLRQQGLREGALAGLCVERGPNLVVALLAILKAGAAYVPLDAAYPSARLAHMVSDSGLRLLLTQQSLRGAAVQMAGGGQDVRILYLDDEADLAALDAEGDAEPPAAAGLVDHPAYVIYTSGSTGMPKGVQVGHRSLSNFVWAMRRELDIGQHDAVLNLTSLSFDIAGLELWLPLACGARIVLISREAAGDPQLLAACIERHGVTVAQATPSTWRMLVQHRWPVAQGGLKVLCGGEALAPALARDMLRHTPLVWNLYGPTETTIWSALHRITADAPYPYIGRPIDNTQIYILDEHLQLAPTGVSGELYIGGDGLAHGYLHRPELTRERFIVHFPAGGRLYRTGDLARRLEDGTLEYLGRIDDQVKIRGFRIELGEVENQLALQPEIDAAVVVAREEASGEKRLVAYLSLKPGMAGPQEFAALLRARLQGILPEYMVPALFVVLPAFPMTPNGKIDKKALPAPEVSALHRPYADPRDENERILLEIWRHVLGLDSIGIHDNFFEIGGDSIMTIQIVARANKAGIPLRPRHLFDFQTVEALARHAVAQAASDESGGPPPMLADGDDSGEPLINPIIHYLHFNQGWGTWFTTTSEFMWKSGEIDLATTVRALHLLVQRYEALRFQLVRSGNQLQHRLMPPPDEQGLLRLEDVSQAAAPDVDSQLNAIYNKWKGDFVFDERSYLFRFVYIKGRPEQGDRLVLIFHHMLVDGESNGILKEAFLATYRALLNGAAPPAREEMPYSFWLRARQRRLQAAQAVDSAYWRNLRWEEAADFQQELAPPMPAPEHPSESFLLDEVSTARLLRLSSAGSSLMVEAILFALIQGIHPWISGPLVLCEMVMSNRQVAVGEADVSGVVGNLTTNNILPIDTSDGDWLPTLDRLLDIRAQRRSVPNEGAGLLHWLYASEALAGIEYRPLIGVNLVFCDERYGEEPEAGISHHSAWSFMRDESNENIHALFFEVRIFENAVKISSFANARCCPKPVQFHVNTRIHQALLSLQSVSDPKAERREMAPFHA
ncbi:non-ribosomal peptide synthetase [Massilia sp. NR 4-1]|uniref:non-ribosomal peptide synthetase n=1 Tax=Massilia sp. NR 4-1 TaxID=1678028 RepID=UPI001CBD89AA|nr:non-ribosomal peptide synthetase [Massilia sp. NR 4-1]